jgi:TRAP transporter TAXI family solute receptor
MLRRFTLGAFSPARFAAALLLVLACVSGPAQAQEERSYILATATTGGTYYPVGVGVATLIKVKLQPSLKIGMSAISSAGSGENIKLMREGQVQFSILQGLYGLWAGTGTGDMAEEGKQDNLRSITMLWQNVEHFLIASRFVKSGDMSDLAAMQGEKFSIGARNSGTEGSGRTILSNLGYNPDELFDLAYLGYGPSAEALQNGTIAGANLPAGPPVGAVTQAFAALGKDVTVLDFTDEQIDRANGDAVLWTRFVIPAGTYPGQDKDIRTVGQPNFLAVNADVPEEDVYQITKAIYENLPFLQNIHAATRDMSLEQSIAGLPLPLHPGALRYYQEAGLSVPDRLVAK